MNETINNTNNIIIPIPPRHIVEKYKWWMFEVSHSQLMALAGSAVGCMAVLGITSMLEFPFNLSGYPITALVAYLYKKYAWTHDKLMMSEAMLWYWWYKRKGLMDISYSDTYTKIKTLFPYEVKNILNGIIYFGSGMYGVLISLNPRKLTPEENTEYAPVVERIIDSLPSELIVKCRAKTVETGENLLEKLVFERLQVVKTKEEKALLFSLYDKSKAHENNLNLKWEHTLFIGLKSTDEEVETYLKTILPGITTMLGNSQVLCTHIIDPIKILTHYSSDFSMYEEDSSSQSVMLVPGISKTTNPLSQMIRGGASFERKQIWFNNNDYAALVIVGIPKDMAGGWPDDLKTGILPQIYALSDSREHIIEINVTIESIDDGIAIAEIKSVLSMIEVNKLSNKSTSNLRILAHSERKYGLILEGLQDGTIHLNEVAYLITVRARTSEKLIAGVSRVQAVLKAHSIKSQVAEGNVKDIFKATRFFPIRYNNISTYMPTDAISKILPLINGSENISSSKSGRYSVYFADDIKTHHEYIFNLNEMGACHAVIVGATRSGKTTGLAVLGMRAVLVGFRVIYITIKPDETTNYLNVAKHLGPKGEIIFLGRGKKNINPLEILFDQSMLFDPKQTFFQHVTILKQFINQLCSSRSTSESLNSLQLAYVERTILRLYSKFGISPTEPATWKQEKQPTLIDLYNIWDADRGLDTKESVQAAVLESRTTSLTHNWDFLSDKTTISLDKDYIVIDLSALPGDLIPAMNYFMTAIIGLRFRADLKRKNIIMIDEGRAFMQTGLGEDIIKIATQGGSQGVAVWFCSQQPKDMASISTELLNNAFIRIVFANNTEVPEVAASLRLPKSDQDFLASCNRAGQMLIQMKSPFNQTYHCELNLSESEKEIVFGQKQEKQDAQAKSFFLNPALAVFAEERKIILADWIIKSNATLQATKDLQKEFVQRAVGAGKVWVYFAPDILREDGRIQNQSKDHYFSAASIGGWLVERGLQVAVNDRDGADVVVILPNGKTLGIEYQTSLPGINTQEKIMEKWKFGENNYDYFFFVSDTAGVKELRSIMKTEENIIPRGTQLENRLNENILKNQN